MRQKGRSAATAAIVCAGVVSNGGIAGGQEGQPSFHNILLDEISVYGTRNAKQLFDVPGTVSVIDRAELDKRMVHDIDDLVRYEPGVSVSRQTSSTDPFGNLGGFTIRGVGGNRVLTLVDGVRVQERVTDGNRDFVDLPNMKAVEIVRGPASVLWGADALGGLVVFRTKDPDDYLKGTGKNYGGQADISWDSFDNTWRKTITAAGQTTNQWGQWQTLISASHRSANEPKLSTARADGGIYGCPRNPQAIRCNELNPLWTDAQTYLGKVIWRPNADHEFKWTNEYYIRDTDVSQKHDLGPVSGAPGTVQLGYLRNQEQTRARMSLSHDWWAKFPLLDHARLQVSYSPQSRESTGERLRRLPGNQFQRLDYFHYFGEDFLEGDLQLNSTLKLGPTIHRLTYGAYGGFTNSDYNRRDVTTNLTTGVRTVANAGGFNFADAETTRADVFLQDEIELFNGWLKVTPAVRYNTYKIDPITDQFYQPVAGFQPRTIEEQTLTKQISAIAKLSETYSVYAKYAEGFKMPTAEQLYTSLPGATFILTPNPNLRPESVQSYEAGLRGKFQSGFFSVGAFYADYSDFIQSLYEVPNTFPTEVTSRNLSVVQLWGVEGFAEVEVYKNWFANLAVTYQYGDQVAVPGAPKTAFDAASPLKAVGGVRYSNPGIGLNAELITTWASGVERTASPNTFRPDGYFVVDTIWSWKPHKDVTLKAAVFNIFEERYFRWPAPYAYTVPPTVAVAIANPLELQVAAGRTFKFGMSVVF